MSVKDDICLNKLTKRLNTTVKSSCTFSGITICPAIYIQATVLTSNADSFVSFKSFGDCCKRWGLRSYCVEMLCLGAVSVEPRRWIPLWSCCYPGCTLRYSKHAIKKSSTKNGVLTDLLSLSRVWTPAPGLHAGTIISNMCILFLKAFYLAFGGGIVQRTT